MCSGLQPNPSMHSALPPHSKGAGMCSARGLRLGIDLVVEELVAGEVFRTPGHCTFRRVAQYPSAVFVGAQTARVSRRVRAARFARRMVAWRKKLRSGKRFSDPSHIWRIISFGGSRNDMLGVFQICGRVKLLK